MTILDQMYSKDRVIITAKLTLANGAFLQPTGFPDIGSCIYTDADGNRRCLVESEQSMANRLEAVCMKSPGRWADVLQHLPVIEVRDANDRLLATNLTEPHRIASSYVLEGKLNGSDVKTMLTDKLGLVEGGASWPLDKRSALEKLVFALDPAALLHGFQFVQWKFVGLRQTRLLSARLECLLAEEPEVHYGMVKFDLLEPSSQGEGTNKGQSIASKSRAVPAKDGIKATFDIDLLGLKNLAVDEPQKKFLLALALWKIGALLSNQASFDARSRQTGPALRLRADCYLSCGETVEWSGSETAVKVSDLLTALADQTVKFDDLTQAQGVTLTTNQPEEGKSAPPETTEGQPTNPSKAGPVIVVIYGSRAAATQPVAPTPPPGAPAEVPQATEN
jgi:CRISPR-associated protein Csb1